MITSEENCVIAPTDIHRQRGTSGAVDASFARDALIPMQRTNKEGAGFGSGDGLRGDLVGSDRRAPT